MTFGGGSSPSNVFVLCTGRSGSRTTARALSHATNWTVGHESRVRQLVGRVDYPPGHMEIDNRLAFFLGPLADRYPDAVWVHLTRNTMDTARSFARTSWKGSRGIMPAFTERIVWAPKAERLQAARIYVETQTANIAEFLAGREHIHLKLEEPEPEFRRLWKRIDAVGDLSAAVAEFGRR